MENPWKKIALSDYENHMGLDSVSQLQAMNVMTKDQLSRHPAKTVMLLGIAGGNGLEHIDTRKVQTLYGVDVNQKYLTAWRPYTTQWRSPRWQPSCWKAVFTLQDGWKNGFQMRKNWFAWISKAAGSHEGASVFFCQEQESQTFPPKFVNGSTLHRVARLLNYTLRICVFLC
jgi:hypothetical protein